jgi:hypothetical protein
LEVPGEQGDQRPAVVVGVGDRSAHLGFDLVWAGAVEVEVEGWSLVGPGGRHHELVPADLPLDHDRQPPVDRRPPTGGEHRAEAEGVDYRKRPALAAVDHEPGPVGVLHRTRQPGDAAVGGRA